MSTLQKYAESSNADLRAEAVMNTLQNKILKKAKPPTENEQVIQELKQKNKAFTNEFLSFSISLLKVYPIKLTSYYKNYLKIKYKPFCYVSQSFSLKSKVLLLQTYQNWLHQTHF